MSQDEPLTFAMRFGRFALRLLGWRLLRNLPPSRKFIMVGAWHTSNWDFILAVLAKWGLGLNLNFIGKKALVEGPLGGVMTRLGIIAVDRSKRGQFVQKIAELFQQRDELMIIVPAEGTRSKSEYWKTGFYYMALAAEVPIAFAFIDAAKKEIGIDGYFMPSGDREADLKVVKNFFKDKRGLKPHKQAEIKFRPVDERYQKKDAVVEETA